MPKAVKTYHNTRNPANEESTLFKKLTRLFSGPIVDRHAQLYRNLRRRQLDKYKMSDIHGKSFKKSTYSPLETLAAQNFSNQGRASRYADFEQMEFCGEISTALDLIADEMTTATPLTPILNIDCRNEEIRITLNSLFYDVLNVEHNLFGWCRNTIKYGDFFGYLDIDDELGVKNMIGLPVNEVERLEGEDTTNPNYIRFRWNNGAIVFENWQIAHFRLLGNDKYAPYGTAIVDGARRVWRQLEMMENAMMSYRIVRAPERRVFYIDVGGIAPADVEQFVKHVISTMKEGQIIDPSTGRVDLRYNPLSTEDDYYIPVRGPNSGTRIDPLPGGQFTGDIQDVAYIQAKLFLALKIPASYLSYGEGASEEKSSLAQKDVIFARTIQRYQRAMISELEKIALIHLYVLGFRGKDLLSFKLSLNNPSKISELQELEHWKTKFDVAGSAAEGFFSKRWLAEKLFGISEKELKQIERELYRDRAIGAELEQLGTPPEAGAGGGGALGMGEEPEAEMPPEEEEGETNLLAAPAPLEPDEAAVIAAEEPEIAAKRADSSDRVREPGKTGEAYLTPGSKGKLYRRQRSDQRKDHIPRRKNMNGMVSAELASNTLRNVVPGYQSLRSMWKGISEDAEIEDTQERLILESNDSAMKMLEKLGDDA